MDNNFNNDNIQPNQTSVPEPNNYDAQYAASNQQPDYSAQYAQYNGYSNQPQQVPEQPQPVHYQPQYQPQPQQIEYNQQTTSAQPYDYNQAGYQQPQPIQYQSYEAPVPEEEPIGAAKGLGIASLVCGIVSILSFCCCGGLFVGIPGLIMGIVSRVKCKNNNSMALVGLILSIVGMVLTIIFIVLYFIGIIDGYNSYDSFYDNYYYNF